MTFQHNLETESVTEHGVTRFSAIPQIPAPIAEPVHEANRVHGGVYRATLGSDAEPEHIGISVHNTANDRPTGSIMATLQSDARGKTVELVPGVPGSRTYLATAIRDGHVKDIGHGRYEDVQAATAEPHEDKQEPLEEPQQAPEENPFMTEEEAKAFTEDIAPLEQHVYDGAVALAMVASVDGADLSKAEERLVKEANMSQEQAEQMVSNVYGLYKDSVIRQLAPDGLTKENADEFFQWCVGKPQLRAAVQKVGFQHDVSGFRELAVHWRASKGSN
jgi:hypothetical protein